MRDSERPAAYDVSETRSADGAASGTTRSILRVAVPDLISNSYFPLEAAVILGFLRDEGIQAELELIYPVSKTLEALREGRIDLAAAAAHSTLSAFPGWHGAKLLACLARNMYWFLVVRRDLQVGRGDLQALRGLRIGAAPGPDQGLIELLREAGLDPEREHIQIGPISALGAGNTVMSFGVNAARALEAGEVDAFWANGMGAEVAVRRGSGDVVLDVRRGDGPPAAQGFTFPALVAREDFIAQQPGKVTAIVRALVATHRALQANPGQASAVGSELFPEEEAQLISVLVERDAPYYDATITEPDVISLGSFAQRVGLTDRVAPYDEVVSSVAAGAWKL